MHAHCPGFAGALFYCKAGMPPNRAAGIGTAMTSNGSHLGLTVLPSTLAVCRLAPDSPIPGWATGGVLSVVARTPDELSLVCADDAVPDGTVA
jgi:hypothetical protein